MSRTEQVEGLILSVTQEKFTDKLHIRIKGEMTYTFMINIKQFLAFEQPV